MLVPASVLGYSYLEKPSSLENSALSRGELLLRAQTLLTWPRILILINCKRFRGCGTFASSRARVLSRSQLSSARTVHELGNEAPLITFRTAGDFYQVKGHASSRTHVV